LTRKDRRQIIHTEVSFYLSTLHLIAIMIGTITIHASLGETCPSIVDTSHILLMDEHMHLCV